MKIGKNAKIKKGWINMASKKLVSSKLRMRYQIGVNDEGKGVFKQQRVIVDTTATANDLIALSNAINDVLDYSINERMADDTSIIS